MKYEEDWLLRQIKIIISLVSKIILKKEISEKEINENLGYGNRIDEFLLSENININSYEYLKIGLNFYDRINKLDDIKLKELNFSREEIELGLREFIYMYGLGYLYMEEL